MLTYKQILSDWNWEVIFELEMLEQQYNYV